jgi:hypothetical protein
MFATLASHGPILPGTTKISIAKFHRSNPFHVSDSILVPRVIVWSNIRQVIYAQHTVKFEIGFSYEHLKIICETRTPNSKPLHSFIFPALRCCTWSVGFCLRINVSPSEHSRTSSELHHAFPQILTEIPSQCTPQANAHLPKYYPSIFKIR